MHDTHSDANVTTGTTTSHETDGFDLDPAELRVLGVLIEKSFITPDNYPLSINALTTGCNQLTAREPVMSLSETEVQDAVDRLIERRLVSQRAQASGRVAKYEHQIRLRHSLPPPEQAVLAILLLRGAQTPGELRQRCERLHRFDDIAGVEIVLEHLADKYPPMVTTLARAPGTKEVRYLHLLGGEALLAEANADQTSASVSSSRGRLAELEDELRALRSEVDALRAELTSFRAQFD